MNAPAPAPETAALAGILEAQRAAFLREGPPSLAQRRADLVKLRTALLARREEFAAAAAEDFGRRPRQETLIMEILPTLQGVDYLHRNLRRFLRPERRRVGIHFQMGSAWIERQPLGVVGILSPWNYPAYLALTPLATALAAGNRAMLKPSEHTPAVSDLLGRMLGEIFPEEQVAVVQGDAEFGAAFSALPFDHLFFTGSTAVGRRVMQAASANLTPVTLELGGKSPVILSRGTDLAKTAASVAYGKLANAGQTCVAPDYALIHESEVEAFAEAYDKAVAALYPEGPASEDYASIVNDRHLARLEALLIEAEAQGARLRRVGVQTTSEAPRKLTPVLIFDVPEEARAAQEEIFGPFLVVVPYREIEEAIAHVNARPRPLALYHFGAEGEERRKILERTTSGGVTLDATLLHVAQEDLPFGGVGASGMGASHGPEGFRAMTHGKSVYRQGRWNGAGLLRPPFGRFAERMLGFLVR